MFSLNINKGFYGNYNFCCTPLRFKSNKIKLSSFKWKSYDYKLRNNITRAKTNIFNIINYNKFEFFFTQTINSTFCRSDLNLLIEKFRYYNKQLKRVYGLDFYYLIIPEFHADKKNWHLHGVLSSAYGVDSYVNKNGYLSISTFDKIGFNSISKIKNSVACSKYITKYVSKDFASTINKRRTFILLF